MLAGKSNISQSLQALAVHVLLDVELTGFDSILDEDAIITNLPRFCKMAAITDVKAR